MTKTLLKLPSMIEDELRAEIAAQKSQLAAQKTQIADQETEIRRLQELVDRLSAHTYR